MKKKHKLITRLAKLLTCYIPAKAVRLGIRQAIIGTLAPLALFPHRKTPLYSYLLAAFNLSKNYHYPEQDMYPLPNFKTPVFGPNSSLSAKEDWLGNYIDTGGGGGAGRTMLDFYARYDTDKVSLVLNILSDEYSKALLVSALLKRHSIFQGLYVIHYYEHIWKYYHLLEACQDSKNTIPSGNGPLHYIDLSKCEALPLGSFKLYYGIYGIFVNFILEQYAYRHLISATAGDFVIDAGACYGDTALYFAHKVGAKGRVYSFEFNPSNLEIFKKNLALNPTVENITILPYPLYSDSKTKVSSSGSGGGAYLSLEDKEDSVLTVSIDELVEEGRIERVDFIKMDIEGSELPALIGAKNTLKRFNPKLAICLYHSDSDYYEIPLFLKELLPHYEFYCDHFSLSVCETVLFGRPS